MFQSAELPTLSNAPLSIRRARCTSSVETTGMAETVNDGKSKLPHKALAQSGSR